ncbi:MAG: transposase [Deltaproteobacteria bacterium]|nr:transposase [Deltaproteobacteria bacterium]
MDTHDYFYRPATPIQKHYEALRAFYHEGLRAAEVATRFGISLLYFKKLRVEFAQRLRRGIDPFFSTPKPGPKKRTTKDEIIRCIVALRKQNYSIADIKVSLESEEIKISLDTIDQILKSEGFAPLPKRTRRERLAIALPSKLEAPKSISLELRDEEFSTEMGAGPLIFLPLLENLGIVNAIQKAGFPGTAEISDVQSVLSFLALKLMGGIRWSHDTKWNMDRALGLFAGLNVLPKATTLSTYSYRVTRAQNRNFLIQLSRIFRDEELENGEFNLDFKAIPHWGDVSVLERNWAGARSKAMKSILSLIVQDPSTGNLSYTNAEIKHRDQNNAVLDFVDFWKKGRGTVPKMLIFDSKFTTYKNLNKLNQSREKIKFLTIRRRSKNLIRKVEEISEEEWQKVSIERSKGKYQKIRAHDGKCKLRHYEEEVRQVILTDHGRQKPTFLITNDFDIDVCDVVKKYARRWLVEQEIAEQIVFFNLNNPSSSIVVKVDFDLTLSLLAHNLYHILANNLPGFEHCTVATINRKFLETGARIKINRNQIVVHLKKKTHLPILFEVPWIRQNNQLSWAGTKIRYLQGTIS